MQWQKKNMFHFIPTFKKEGGGGWCLFDKLALWVGAYLEEDTY